MECRNSPRGFSVCRTTDYSSCEFAQQLGRLFQPCHRFSAWRGDSHPQPIEQGQTLTAMDDAVIVGAAKSIVGC